LDGVEDRMKILVTGGLGFIGSHLVTEFVRQGHAVRVLDNLDPEASDRALRGMDSIVSNNGLCRAELVRADVRDADACRAACSRVDAVFHHAAVASIGRAIRNPDEAFEINVLGTENVLKAARACGVRRVVFSSSGKVYGNATSPPFREDYPLEPVNAYAASKVQAESVCRRLAEDPAMQVVSLRYFSVYGPGQSLSYGFIGQALSGLLNGGAIEIDGPKDMERNFTYISDVVAANVCCLKYERPGYSVFNIGSERSYTVGDLIDIVEKALWRSTRVHYRNTPDGSVYRTAADITAARRHLGYEPRVTLPIGIRQTIEWVRKLKASSSKASSMCGDATEATR
jgi:nucleoside-diphosphate-sugar epimerase